MGKNQKPVIPEKILRIEVIELPQFREADEGLYEVRWGHKPKEIETHDILTLKKYLDNVLKEYRDSVTQTSEDILDRLQNFRISYINFASGEISS